ncbi:ThuA domain-containing protein [Larkinella soli]|uniref:ThuA domain-containing protein n=1 Tax=Larkinella soli TaxID=1770527 RepID=UPI000FFB2EE9|nr:ThuA domain-containing protein [Larkinella soli]
MRTLLSGWLLSLLLAFSPAMNCRTDSTETAGQSGKKRIVFIAGGCSHPHGEHEHKAGCLLLAKRLNEALPSVEAEVYSDGWPKESAFRNAAAIVVYGDGGEGNVTNRHLDQIDALMKKGVGLTCIHFAVEVPKGRPGDHYLNWIGGYFEPFWSVNPVWTAEFTSLPQHPVTRGVKPFTSKDEWYYHMRFREGMEGVTPILTTVPPASTLNRPEGSHSSNPHVRAEIGKPQHLAWCRERPDGGRGFGITGGHYHRVWADDNYRKLVLNAIAWTAGVDLPAGGVDSPTPTPAEMEANQCIK